MNILTDILLIMNEPLNYTILPYSHNRHSINDEHPSNINVSIKIIIIMLEVPFKNVSKKVLEQRIS